MCIKDRDALISALMEIADMPQTTKELQEALRARRAMLGMTEVRGIYLPPDLHAELKYHAKRMLAARERMIKKAQEAKESWPTT
jgi:hypothetical protein